MGSDVRESPELSVWRKYLGGGSGESVPPLLWVLRQFLSSGSNPEDQPPAPVDTWGGHLTPTTASRLELWVRLLELCWSMKKVFTQKWNSLLLLTYRGLKHASYHHQSVIGGVLESRDSITFLQDIFRLAIRARLQLIIFHNS